MAWRLSNVATPEVSVIYDGGRCPLQFSSVQTAFTNSEVAQIAAAPGLRTKVLGVTLTVIAYTAAGNVLLLNGTGGPAIQTLSFFSGFGSSNFSLGGLVLCQTNVNTLLSVKFTGTATIGVNITYYQAP